MISIEKAMFYVNITADPLYNERTPMDELVPSFFQKITFFVGGLMNGLSSIFNFVDERDPYDDKHWYKTKLDKIVGT